MPERISPLLVTVALAVALAGCGSSSGGTNAPSGTASGTPAASVSPSADPVAVPPVSDVALEHGSAPHQISETLVAFYRAAWENNATQACSLFSSDGSAGFLRAAAVSFPQSVNRYSTCEHAMEIYNASLGVSASTAQDNDPAFSTAALDNVGSEAIKVSGKTATAIAPTNVVELINPKLIDLVHVGGRWLIEGSHSLNASNLEQILRRAKAKGLLTPKRSAGR